MEFMVQSATMKRKQKVTVAVLTVIVLAVSYLFASSYSIYRPIHFNEATLDQASKWVQVNVDTSRHEGAVTLPPSLASVSATGKAYVTNGIIFFPSWVGRKTLIPDPLNSEADWVEGFGFSAKSLPTEASEPVGSTQFFCMMDLSDPAHTPDNGENGREMAVDSRIGKQWYEIDSFS